jgi:hypothetical protein
MIDELETAAVDDTLDVSELIDLLTQVRAMRSRLGLIESEIVGRIARGRSHGEVLDGGRAVVKYGAERTTWDRDAARRGILALEREHAITSGEWAIDPDTGEKVPTWEAALEVVQRYWNLADPRVTPMKEAGIDPSEYRTRTGRTVRVETMP